MDSGDILGIAASTAGMAIGASIGAWHNRRYGENRRFGAIGLGALAGLFIFGVVVLMISV